jgi:hypothetical protein
MIALRIGTFRVLEKQLNASSLFLSENYNRTYAFECQRRAEFFNFLQSVTQAALAQLVSWLPYGLDDRWIVVRFSSRVWDLPLFRRTQTVSYIQTGLCSMDTEFSSAQGSKRLRREGGHLSVHDTGLKNVWCYTSTASHSFMALCLVKNRDNFTFINFML